MLRSVVAVVVFLFNEADKIETGEEIRINGEHQSALPMFKLIYL